MSLKTSALTSESRFATYVEAITSVFTHTDRAAPFRSYCAGLLLSAEHKSVEPIAVRVHPVRVR